MSEDELSELTSEEDELDCDDSQRGNNNAPRVTRAGGGSEGYKLQKALKPPRATTYTAQALYDQIHSGDINLEPEYQRDVVWTKEKQTGLIDSILRNFYIPPIIFAVNTYDDGSESKTCIDGKQRLTSIHRFMDGLIPHRDPITNEKLWFKGDGSQSNSKTAKTKKLLPEKYRTMFANKQIVCVEYGDLTDSDERDIFQRVQLGMALTSAEKLHVINTPRAHFVRAILASHVTEDTLASPSLPWDTTRGSDFRCIAQGIFCMDRWHGAKNGSQMKNAGTLPQVEKWLVVGADGKKGGKGWKDDDEYGTVGVEVSESFAKRVRETYDVFAKLATTSKYSDPFTAYPKVSPIEIICIALLIYVHGVLPPPQSRLTLTELRDIISQMRDDVRLTHKDIRMNDRVGKTMIEFIKVVSKDHPLKKSKKQDHENASTASSTRPKRKRQSAAIDDDDDEYRESSSSSRAKRVSASQLASPTKRRSAKLQEAVPSGSGPNRHLPTPTSISSSASAPVHRKGDMLASMRAAKAATASAQREEAMPNPQKLPSPGAGPSFSLSGGLLNSAGGPTKMEEMEQMWRGMMGMGMPPLSQMQMGMAMPGMMNGPLPGPNSS